MTNALKLDHFLNITLHNKPFTANITLIKIELCIGGSQVGKVATILQRLKNLDTIILNIPKMSPTRCERILKNLDIPRLQAFFTKTAPHKGLVSFLKRHPQLSSLDLRGHCDEIECFLHKVPPSKGIKTIEGPSRCISKLIVESDLIDVTATYNTPLDTHVHTFTSISHHNIAFLALDFSLEHDQDILRKVAGAAPRVSTLRLSEKFPNKNRVSLAFSLPFQSLIIT